MPQRRLFGMIKLPGDFAHPLGDELVDRFPVAPIAYRLGSNGRPNALGAKYERLWRFAAELSERVSQLELAESMACCHAAGDEFSRLALSIIGRPSDSFCGEGEPSTLTDVLISLLLTGAPEMPMILQSMALTLDVNTRI